MTFTPATTSSPRLFALATLLTFGLVGPEVLADDPQPAAAAEAPADQEAKAADTNDAAASDKEAKGKDEEKEVELKKVVVAEKRIELVVPATWSERERQNNIIEKEFLIYETPLKKGEEPKEDTPSGRLTLSASGGTVDQNMRRWIGQFRLGRDADGEDAVQQEAIELEGGTLHLLDITGTYFDSPRGPFGPKVERTDYRMLGAIIEIEDGPLYFVKFYGPEKIVEANAKDFRKMVRATKIAPEGGEAASDDKPKTSPNADEKKRDN